MPHRRTPSPLALIARIITVTAIFVTSVTATSAGIAQAQMQDIRDPLAADVLYLAPASFHAALQPLLAYRTSHGVRAVAIDTQAIYDAWSAGQPDALAIRAFLRHARAAWPTPPHTVVFAGDADVVPTHIAAVDSFNDSAACDWCLVQLDGAHPTDDATADMRYGRLPVRSSSELAALARKIVRHETLPGQSWRSRMSLIADNFLEADGSADEAGNFAWLLDEAAAAAPAMWVPNFVYYDPSVSAAGRDAHRIADSTVARAQTRAAFESGSGLMIYSGHGLPDRWASISPGSDGATWLLKRDDVSTLQNVDRLPVVLELACLTSAFHERDANGALVGTIDESLVRAPGGAVATIGFTGLSVTYVNEIAMRGVLRRVRAANGEPVTVGELLAAAQLALRDDAQCCNDTLRTMVLFGDPLTPLRTEATRHTVLLPVVQMP
jgi:hypothetical protein